MEPHVTLESVLGGKGEVADVAPDSAGCSVVKSLVHSQRRPDGKPSAASVALVRFLSRVRPDVARQIAGLLEPLGTVLTLEGELRRLGHFLVELLDLRHRALLLDGGQEDLFRGRSGLVGLDQQLPLLLRRQAKGQSVLGLALGRRHGRHGVEAAGRGVGSFHVIAKITSRAELFPTTFVGTLKHTEAEEEYAQFKNRA